MIINKAILKPVIFGNSKNKRRFLKNDVLINSSFENDNTIVYEYNNNEFIKAINNGLLKNMIDNNASFLVIGIRQFSFISYRLQLLGFKINLLTLISPLRNSKENKLLKDEDYDKNDIEDIDRCLRYISSGQSLYSIKFCNDKFEEIKVSSVGIITFEKIKKEDQIEYCLAIEDSYEKSQE